jgi:hypothetical protein
VADLILGPLLRFVGETEATVWLETDAPCAVEVLGEGTRTFCVAGHHYGVVAISGLEPGRSYEYAVALDGQRRWPDPAIPFPASRIRTLLPGQDLRVAFGSCRVAAPHRPPYELERSEDPLGLGVDALLALALQMRHQPPEAWPSLLLMLGDQVYADAASPQTREFIRSRRSTSEPPGDEVADFEEYTRLYREAWSDPAIRWMLSTLPSAMIFDDHEVIDDWNISEAWKREIQSQPWWPQRIAGAFMSYWIYQHLGNLSPGDLAEDDLYQRVRGVEDAGALLHEFGLNADRTTTGSRWSYQRQLGRSRLVVIDSRAGRLLRDGRREMVDDEEWRWLDAQLRGDVDHLLVATSVPFLLPRSIHDLEGFSEAICAGVWGNRAARLGERVRRAIDLEHWAAFRSSFDRLAHALREVGTGGRGTAPASIILLSGDVHYSYLAEASLGEASGHSHLYQAVCSPFRHPLDPPLVRANRFAFRRTPERIGAVLARSTRVAPTPLAWRIRRGPYFSNQLATLELRGRQARLRLHRTAPHQPRLDVVADDPVTPAG